MRVSTRDGRGCRPERALSAGRRCSVLPRSSKRAASAAARATAGRRSRPRARRGPPPFHHSTDSSRSARRGPNPTRSRSRWPPRSCRCRSSAELLSGVRRRSARPGSAPQAHPVGHRRHKGVGDVAGRRRWSSPRAEDVGRRRAAHGSCERRCNPHASAARSGGVGDLGLGQPQASRERRSDQHHRMASSAAGQARSQAIERPPRKSARRRLALTRQSGITATGREAGDRLTQ